MGIGNIGNYYGGLAVKDVDGEFYWGIRDWDGYYWEAIPKYLYDALVKFELESQAAED